MSVKELNIPPVGRVEGDLDVKVYIDNGKVTRAHTQAAMFRGFHVDNFAMFLNQSCKPRPND